jgi:SAM-dependent methyltransferase
MAFFDHFAYGTPTRIGAWIEKMTKRREQAYISRFLKSTEAEILEIGSGQGQLAQVFIDNGFSRFDACESNPLMNSRLADIGVRTTSNLMVPPIQAPDDSYDLMIMTDVLEHLADVRLAQELVREARRVLRHGGIIAIISPDCRDWKSDFFNCDFTHNYVTTLRRTRQLLYDSGFRIKGSRYTYGPFTGATGFIANLCVKTLTFPASGARSDEDKLYKLRLTFLRRFAVVGVIE